MSKLGARWNSLGTVGSVVLGSLCLGGAIVYTAVVGASIVAAPAIRTEAAAQTMSGLSELPQAPVASLEIRVDDGEKSYEQHLDCTGDPLADPAACAQLAANSEEEDAAGPFEEVDPGAICTDDVYGPESAVVSGTWNGVAIHTEVTRAGSCEEARWQRLKPLVEPFD
ncbi:hypothetical protein [Thermobifida cellulosilytica]|jgi:hypothetical protein|uniref:Subtilisin inhibitor domain-containing protein n=1 Tax=Thermobifida cellulosilytica TB100 TaxID=665004 RepID=A0A147KDF7_THECS|nr:hypothetical protein [Thermobifida cellulosilytica]KUP95298.1 hypothetical protein AC529_18375 [Thermobifida cellulosilytica TB100]